MMMKQFLRRVLTKQRQINVYPKIAQQYQFSSFKTNDPNDKKELVISDDISAHHSEGTAYFEINDIKGAKAGGLLYALSFTCGPCNHKMIRTFTQRAYHNGVVIVRCENCNNNHLIADNLGWFEDNKWNVEIYAKAKKLSSPQVQTILQGFLGQMEEKQKQ